MQFGSSSQAVFFKMRVAGVLHVFQFETRQGEDICMALQTHINDIMMKRYAKVVSGTGVEIYHPSSKQMYSCSSSCGSLAVLIARNHRVFCSSFILEPFVVFERNTIRSLIFRQLT